MKKLMDFKIWKRAVSRRATFINGNMDMLTGHLSERDGVACVHRIIPLPPFFSLRLSLDVLPAFPSGPAGSERRSASRRAGQQCRQTE